MKVVTSRDHAELLKHQLRAFQALRVFVVAVGGMVIYTFLAGLH